MAAYLIGLINLVWHSFFPPTLTVHFPPQTVDPDDSMLQALDNGEVVEMTPRKIVFEDDAGNKVTLKGRFWLDEEEEIDGVIRGFSSEDDGTEVYSGSGFNIGASKFLMAVDTYGPKDGLQMFFERAEVFEGSEYGDWLDVSDIVGPRPLANEGISAEAFRVAVKGLDGDDNLIGGRGEQILQGGKDNDTLFGGFDGDRDFLVGGADQDFFMVLGGEAVPQSAVVQEAGILPVYPVDHLVDFSSEDDTIVFLGQLNGEEPLDIAAQVQAVRSGQVGFIGEEQFHQGHTATSEDHRFVYNKWTGELFVDQDGSGDSYGQMLIATLEPGTHVEASDIYVGEGMLLAL